MKLKVVGTNHFHHGFKLIRRLFGQHAALGYPVGLNLHPSIELKTMIISNSPM